MPRYDARLEAGTTPCIEGCIGPDGGAEGVKLEEQVLVNDPGIEALSALPLELDRL